VKDDHGRKKERPNPSSYQWVSQDLAGGRQSMEGEWSCGWQLGRHLAHSET
jgi:hypothetical protein